MDTVSVSLEVLGGALAKSTLELQSALMTDGNDGKKIPVDQTQIDKFVAENLRTRLADQKKAGEKEFSSFGKRTAFDEVEKYLLDNHGIPKGTDWATGLASVISDAKSKAPTTDEVVKASEPYKALALKLQTTETALNDTKTGFRERLKVDNFQRQLNEVLSDETLGLALPDDSSIRANQLKSFQAFVLSQAKLDLNDKEELIPIGADGKQLEDPNFNPLTLKTFVINNAKTFWPTKSAQAVRTPPPAGQPGGSDGQTSPPAGIAYPKFKDAQELSNFTDKAILEGKDVAFVTGALAAYESQPK